ncbi:hypothetical protein QEN19_001456 [Hanseniaspora menglaensis]
MESLYEDRLKKLYETTLKVSKHKKLLNKAVLDFDKTIHRLEFESYHEYFQIKSFKKGFSESGIVNLEDVRHKDRPLYYKKYIRRDKKERDQSSVIKNTKLEEQEANDSKITGEKGSKITSTRRSVRLNKTEEATRTDNNSEYEKMHVMNQSNKNLSSLHLPEDIVYKVSNPVRRSDLILPPKNRFIRERQPAIKPESNRLIKYSTFVNMPTIKKFVQKCGNSELKKKKRKKDSI